MNLHKTKFIEILKDPTVTKLDIDLSELESLVETYPYFQSGRILLAKEKYTLNAIDFKKYIVDAAVHTTDRRLLKRYIEQNVQIVNEGSTHIVEKEPTKTPSESPDDTTVTEAFHTDIDTTSTPTLSDTESSLSEVADAAAENDTNTSSTQELIEPIDDSITEDNESGRSEGADTLDESKNKDHDVSTTSLDNSNPLTQEISSKEATSEVTLDHAPTEGVSNDALNEEDRLIKEKIAKYRSALGSPSIDTPADPIIPSEEGVSSQIPETGTLGDLSIEEEPLEKGESLTEEEPLEKEESITEEESLEKEKSIIDVSTSSSQELNIASIPTETEPPLDLTPTTDIANIDQAPDPDVPTSSIDHLISEVRQDMKDLRASKLRFKAMMSKIDDEEKTSEQAPPAIAKKEILKKKKETKKKESKTKIKKVGTSPKEKAKGTVVKQNEKPQPDQQEQKKIVDEFIDNNPKIKPVKATGTKIKPEDLSAKSSEFKPEASSEYLARIYIEQNKKRKAIAIYESLSLKFPEKKSYFAGLIKKLKTK